MVPRYEQLVKINRSGLVLEGVLGAPPNAIGVVVFAHGSGSGRFSPRNGYVAKVLQERGIATLLLDLLTEHEAEDRAYVFAIELLADRLLHAKHWLHSKEDTASLALAYFGASTGAGAALVAAAREPEDIFAVVSRGGRPDLASGYLRSVTVPTLLIVGGDDEGVIDLNYEALKALQIGRAHV